MIHFPSWIVESCVRKDIRDGVVAWKTVEDVSLPVVPQAILDFLNVVYYALITNKYGNYPSYYRRSKTCAIYIGVFVVSFMRRCPNVLSRCEKGNVVTIVGKGGLLISPITGCNAYNILVSENISGRSL
jgi:hypothetical protein